MQSISPFQKFIMTWKIKPADTTLKIANLNMNNVHVENCRLWLAFKPQCKGLLGEILHGGFVIHKSG